MNFESYSDMWFRSPPTLFQCIDTGAAQSSSGVTFFDIWQRVVLVCFLQAAGTAIGEIPPYWMTRAARLAALESGSAADDADDIPEELEVKSKFGLINKFKEWMVSFLQTHGFYGVLSMASFPNVAFDLCGICCGHYLMPFWTFFWATFIGKAIIRNSYQSVIYVALCRFVACKARMVACMKSD
jgi:vacuole membrane protein 1